MTPLPIHVGGGVMLGSGTARRSATLYGRAEEKIIWRESREVLYS